MKTLIVKITGAQDKSGLYQAQLEEWETLDSMLKVYKIGKNGQPLKNYDFFPFRSYHNNRDAREAYNERYKGAKIEVVEELGQKEENGIMFAPNGEISFEFNGHKYALLHNRDAHIKKSIYIDDESEYYREYCHAGATKQEQMRKALFMGENELPWHLKNLDEKESYWQYFNTTIDKIRKEATTPTLRAVIAYYDKLEEAHNAGLEAYYKRYGKNVYVHGYWANR